MNVEPLARDILEPAFNRLTALARLAPDEVDALRSCASASWRVAAHGEIAGEQEPVRSPSLILNGWACRARIFRDGRRQILSFLVPGDLINVTDYPDPLATTMVTAVTGVTLCPVPHPVERGSGLAIAYAVSAALQEAYLFRQIARLGRMSAYERLIDLIAEMHERMLLSGMATPDGLAMPLTQEILADALGLTSVHLNRTMQLIRREGIADVRSGRVTLLNPMGLAQLCDSRPARVSASLPRSI